MPYILKELLYHAILYDYGVGDKQEQDDSVLDLDNASVEEIQRAMKQFNE